MTRNIWRPALALGAVLAVGNVASADDTRPLAPASSTTMTLGGKGTAEQAATEDTELARGYRGGYYGGYRGGYGFGYGGYRGGYYGGGYRGYYGGGYYGGFGGYYRPAYYYAPRYYYPSYYGGGYGGYYPGYSSFYYSSPSFGFSLGIGGNTVAASAPVVPIGATFSPPQPMTAPTVPGDGTFRYDGGPAAPVPQPKADPQPIPPAGTSFSDLPISLKPKAATSPYKYKAYGEK